MLVFGCMALLGSFLALLLPETLNKKLPDTIEQAENICHGDGGQAEDDVGFSKDPEVENVLLDGPLQPETFI